jgi:hypothetical protein
LLTAANRRYLAFLYDLQDPRVGLKKVEQLAAPARKDDRTYPGFHRFSPALDLFVALCRGEWQIRAFQNRSLRGALPLRTGPPIYRLLKRLHVQGLIRKVGRTCQYYLTKCGQEVVLTALKLRELVVIPALAGVPAACPIPARLARNLAVKRLKHPRIRKRIHAPKRGSEASEVAICRYQHGAALDCQHCEVSVCGQVGGGAGI